MFSGTEASDPLLTPVSDLPSFTPGADYSPYPCQLQQQGESAVPSSRRMFPTPPPSVSYKQEGTDGFLQLDSSTGPPAEAQSSQYYCLSSGVVSPADWASSGVNQLNRPQFSWDGHNSPQLGNTGNHPQPYDHSFPRQMPLPSYNGGADFSTQQRVESASLGSRNEVPVASTSIEQTPAGPVPEGSPEAKGQVPASFKLEDKSVRSSSGRVDKPQRNGGTKNDDPYAQHLWRALINAKGHTLELREIYQWFVDNTDKANSEGKGWQNSVRHNLSMNAAFVKSQRKSDKKSTAWTLAEWAIHEGVQSTTRYRKGNPTRRGGSGAHHQPHGRGSSIRKSGINTSKNRVAGASKQLLSQTANQELLNRHINPYHGTGAMYNRPLGFVYPPNAQNTHPIPNNPDWLGHSVPTTTGLSLPSYEMAGYTYGNVAHNQIPSSFEQRDDAHVAYQTPDIVGPYGGPQVVANSRFPNQNVALSPSYNHIFSNPQEPTEKPNFFAWDAPSGAGSYV
ncbi:putative winged helix DNA-binding protein [Rosellinia necatrix]|uniref:Putative winged helix DNA-binding protein n=1 Tax=Rosellinia necatrix TaxID=77044 RepID=A0A1W2TIY7_ROSNE|nr:putative winged helix DNA-binding protein [Rosellinia necatrix]